MDPEEQELLNDYRYRSYSSVIEKALRNFESSSEWADLISSLGKLNKALQSNLKYSLLPRRLIISKRLAQCLHPALPSGVHLKALETYEIIFKIVGTKWLAKDLFLYRTDALLLRLSVVVGREVFYAALWGSVLTSPSIRLPASLFVVNHISRDSPGKEQKCMLGTDYQLTVRSLCASLLDANVLVQRNNLEIILFFFPFYTCLVSRVCPSGHFPVTSKAKAGAGVTETAQPLGSLCSPQTINGLFSFCGHHVTSPGKR